MVGSPLGNLTIGVGALSYDGQLNITVVVDRDWCPDLDAFVRVRVLSWMHS